uniref:Uncharacterized protein n=1 Tax=Rhizophora mucronata TaxID=61149 RepID=A0A2P2Q3K6_RHIMU
MDIEQISDGASELKIEPSG